MNTKDGDARARLAGSPKVVAIGEIGLDFFRDLSPREDQYLAFREQLAIARAVNLPVVIHSRNADEEVYEVLAEHAEELGASEDRLIGVMHCYPGDLSLALRYIRLGFAISIAGPVTSAQSNVTRAVAGAVPLIPEAALQIADPQVRYLGTIGGNVANGDPGNGMPRLMQCTGATFELHGPAGPHTLVSRDGYRSCCGTR